MKSHPNEKDLEQLLEQIPSEPSARLDHRLTSAPWTPRAVAHRRTVVFTTAGLLTLALFLIFTPQGRVLAQNVQQFFTRAEIHTRTVATLAPTLAAMPENPTPVASVKPPAGLPFQETCGSLIEPHCSPDELRKMVAFPVLELATLPIGYELIGATGGPNITQIVYRGEAGTLQLSQSPAGSSEDDSKLVGYAAEIETVSIGDATGEYVQGMWVDEGQNSGSVSWDARIPQRTLRWEKGGIRYTITFLPAKTDGGFEPDKTFLINLAAQLAGTSPFTLSKHPTPGADITSVVKQAGFAVDLPAWLPDRFDFVTAAYVSNQNAVCLYFSHPGSEQFAHIVIIESPRSLSLEDIKLQPQYVNGQQLDIPIHIANVAVGGAQNGQAFYASNGLDISRLCGNENLYSNHILLWQSGSKSYIISALLDVYDGRSFLTEMEMRRIAEGLAGATNIPVNALDPEYLSSIADAKSLADFTVKAPGQMPADMHFAYAVYRDTQAGPSPVSIQDDGSEVILTYFGSTFDNLGRRHSIVIHETAHPASTVEEMLQGTGEWVKVNGLPAAFWQSCIDEATGGSNAYCDQMLAWDDENGIRFEIDTHLPGALGKETLIAIAESMR